MKITNLLAIAVMASLAACAVKDDKASKVAMPEGNNGSPQGKVSADILAGGQPGKITLAGALVQRDQDKNALTLKSNITVNPAAGKAMDGTMAQVDNEHQPFMALTKADSKLEKIDTDKSYMVVGCTEDQVDKTYTNGLELKPTPDLKDAKFVDLSAKVVFICGEVITSSVATVVKADHLILNNANIENFVSVGALDVGANTLVLTGQNKISTLGQNAAGQVIEAASLDVNVTKELGGDGSLAIVSQGGNVISETQQSPADKLQGIHDRKEEAELKAQSAPAVR